MSKNGLELKSAIQSLKVNRPFDLRAQKGLQMKPPTPSQVPTETSSGSVEEQPSPETTQPTVDSVETQPSQSLTQSQSDSAAKRPSHGFTQSELDQLPGYLRSQIQISSEGQITHRGFLQRSHAFRVFRKLLSPSEFMVLDYLWDSAWDGTKANGLTRKSLSKIQEGTALKLSAIKLVLKSLQDKGLIQIREKSMKVGILWQVPSFLMCSTPTGTDPVENGPSQNATSSQPSAGQADGQNPTRFKEPLRKENSKNTLSPSMPETIKKYFNELKPERKRKLELRAYYSLRNDFLDSEIDNALKFILINGTPGHSTPCHSPMTYLAVAISEVLTAIKIERDKNDRRERARSQIEAQLALMNHRNALEQTELKAREEAFEQTFPTQADRDRWIKYCASRYPMIDPNGPILKNLAISAWWDSRKNTE